MKKKHLILQIIFYCIVNSSLISAQTYHRTEMFYRVNMGKGIILISCHEKRDYRFRERFTVAWQMVLPIEAVHKRGRRNDRPVLRKTVAAISHRTLGIPVTEIARSYDVDPSSVSRMLDDGEAYRKKLGIEVELQSNLSSPSQYTLDYK